jgi:hypothetical protein
VFGGFLILTALKMARNSSALCKRMNRTAPE